jgi:lipoate-protein ligase A
MIFVDNENINDPRVNLAIEEHLVRNFRTEEDILLFYINQPSIIIGRNQNTYEEINQKYVDEHGSSLYGGFQVVGPYTMTCKI